MICLLAGTIHYIRAVVVAWSSVQTRHAIRGSWTSALHPRFEPIIHPEWPFNVKIRPPTRNSATSALGPPRNPPSHRLIIFKVLMLRNHRARQYQYAVSSPIISIPPDPSSSRANFSYFRRIGGREMISGCSNSPGFYWYTGEANDLGDCSVWRLIGSTFFQEM
jgi:hypothetical protein